MLHSLDVKANYWGLWTEADNLARYNEKYPRGFERLRTQLGYRLRPAWVWQRKRYGTSELVICIANRGVAGVPGVLWLKIESPDKTVSMEGAFDAGHPYGGGSAASLLPPAEGLPGQNQSFGTAGNSSRGEESRLRGRVNSQSTKTARSRLS